MKRRVPIIAEFLLRIFSESKNSYSVLGDYEEEFNERCNSVDSRGAKFWYWQQVINSIVPFIFNKIFWGTVMLKNYLKITLRNIKRQKVFSFINIFGLAVGMACTILIMLWVVNEINFDKHNENSDRIYRLNRYFYNGDGAVSLRLRFVAPPIAPLLMDDFPEVLKAARIRGGGGLFTAREKYFEEREVYFADPEITDIFTFEVTKGNIKNALSQPFSMAVTEETAARYFGTNDVIGETIKMETDGKLFDFQISAVIKSFPQQSHWEPEIIISFVSFTEFAGYDATKNWSKNNFATYLLLPEDYSCKNLEAKFPEFLERHCEKDASSWTSLELQSMSDIHFDGDFSRIYVTSALALFILIIACVNFMNLSTARSVKRSKEVGIRKSIGAERSELVKQFLGEALIMSFIGLFFALVLVYFLLPGFNNLFYSKLSFGMLFQPGYIISVMGISLFVGLISGTYPALFLSSFNPVKVLQNNKKNGNQKYSFRTILVIFQFTISIFLIICINVLNEQMDYISNKDLGYDKENVVVLRSNEKINEKIDLLKNELKTNPGIKNVTLAKRIPSEYLSDSMGGIKIFRAEGEQGIDFRIAYLQIDEDYLTTFNITLASGRNFSRERTTDKEEAFILNECAVKKIGWSSADEAVGQEFKYGPQTGKIIGVVKDFHFESLQNEITPVVMMYSENAGGQVALKLSGEDLSGTLQFIENKWAEYQPKTPVNYSFIEDRLMERYILESVLKKLVAFSVFLALFIACLGLFGLAAFIIENRVKEIGIRKVLGASVAQIIYLLSKEFIKWILISNILAWPLAYLLMEKWLQDYPYRIEIGFTVFIISGLFALAVALFTVFCQSGKAALANPIDSIKYE